MNNRIKELAIQAGYNPVWNTKADREEYFDKDVFAELLLAECLDVVRNTPRHCARTTYDLDTVECTIENSVQALKNHFGV